MLYRYDIRRILKILKEKKYIFQKRMNRQSSCLSVLSQDNFQDRTGQETNINYSQFKPQETAGNTKQESAIHDFVSRYLRYACSLYQIC